MMLQTLGLFLLLQPVALYCKLILLSNASELVMLEEIHAEILNTSLQRFDNFTLCARYGITGYHKSVQTCCQIPHLQLLDVL